MSGENTFTIPGVGLKCKAPGCGAVLHGVAETITTSGFITRKRKCSVCGFVNITDERVMIARPVRRYCSDPCE